MLGVIDAISFNSRTPGGVRPSDRFWLSCIPLRFNSRPREGCDNQHGENLENEAEFQFTHPGRGATRVECADIEELRRFQFTHPGRGATQPYIVSGLLT